MSHPIPVILVAMAGNDAEFIGAVRIGEIFLSAMTKKLPCKGSQTDMQR